MESYIKEFKIDKRVYILVYNSIHYGINAYYIKTPDNALGYYDILIPVINDGYLSLVPQWQKHNKKVINRCINELKKAL